MYKLLFVFSLKIITLNLAQASNAKINIDNEQDNNKTSISRKYFCKGVTIDQNGLLHMDKKLEEKLDNIDRACKVREGLIHPKTQQPYKRKNYR